MPIIAILSALAQFAPAVASYFGKGEAVAGAVATLAQSVSGTSSPEAALAAISASQELQVKFKQAVMENETNLQQIYLQDTQNARLRDIELAKVGQTNRRANVLAALAILIVVMCLGVTVLRETLDEYAKSIITMVIGTSLGWVSQIFNFEFGTTRANKTKDDTINKLSGS